MPKRHRRVARVRGVIGVAVVLLLAACSSDGCKTAKCTNGVTFYVADVAGSLARGTEEPLHICLDGSCHDVTVTRQNVGGSIFVAFDKLTADGDHDLTLAGTGAMKGEYHGALATYADRPNGPKCPGSCVLATVKVGSTGTLTPGVPAPPKTPVTTVAAAASTTSG